MEYDVKFSVNQREVTKEPIEFLVNCDGKRLGTLEISKGRVTWKAKYGVKPNTYKFTWEQFDKHIRDDGEKNQ